MPVMYKDIVEQNGETIFQNNLKQKHSLVVGTKVTYADGSTYIVAELTRDCDGTPLYTLQEYVTYNSKTLSGITEDELVESL